MARQALADPQIEQVFLGEVVALEVTTRERFGMTFRFHLVTLVPRTIWKGPVSATIEHSLFQGGTPPTCLDAADTDDSGTLQITDAIALLNALFLGAPPPPPPGPERCGTDPSADALDCSSFGSCP
jgi:hypothetical protein